MTGVAVGALLWLVYTYAGYPLLVAGWSRIAPRRSQERADYEPSVSVCMAAYNGEQHLAAKLESLRALDYPADKLEILVCSDGSRDGTADALRRLAAEDPRLVALVSEQRLGKPTAVNALRQRARGEVLLMTDVRQPLAPAALRELVRPLADPSVGCVSGSLVLRGDTGASAYWRYERFIRGSEARLGGMVGVSGSLYALRREDLGELPADVLLDDMFVPLSVARDNKRIVLAESAEAYDDACDDEREFARKVRTLAGNYQLVAKLPWLLLPGTNPVWFQLVSHKLCRLLCPWALLALFCSSGLLAFDAREPYWGLALWRALFLSQLLFYALSLVGARAGRAGALARTFLILNAAAVVGLWRFARGSQAVTW